MANQERFADACNHWALERLYTDLALVKSKDLSPCEKECLRGFLCGYSLEDIAKELNRKAPGLNVDLSRGLYRYIEQLAQQKEISLPEKFQFSNIPFIFKQAGYQLAKVDWSNAPDVRVFFGRTEELAKLKQWIIDDNCRLVAILGIGGIGKTSISIKLGKAGIGKTDLSVKLAQSIQEEFDYVVWRSLRDAPKVIDILIGLIKFLSKQPEAALPENLEGKLSCLIDCLRSSRCLIILDNAESILCDGDRAGQYRDGYEDYGQLFNQVGKVNHKSCLLLTSREKPQEIALLEGAAKPVRCLALSGLNVADAIKIFQATCEGNFFGSDDEWKQLVELYNGNPLALEIVAKRIEEVYLGNIADFLIHEKPVFGNLCQLLDWHFERLNDLEKEVMYWLSINREPVSYSELKEDIVSSIAKENLSDTLQFIQRRLPLEKSLFGFSLQPVLVEYMTEKFIKQVSEEIKTGDFSFFKSYTLFKASAKDYVRDSQIRLILQPIYNRLILSLGKQNLENILKRIIANAQANFPLEAGYLGGNVLNFLSYMQINLKKFDFSHLNIWQADLRGVNLQDVNFESSNLSKSVFTQNLGAVISVAFSPDGTILATGDYNGDVRLWKVDDSKELFILKGHTRLVYDVSFSQDSKTLATSSGDKTIRKWNALTGKCEEIIPHPADSLWSYIILNNNLLISLHNDHIIKLWDVQANKYVCYLHGHKDEVFSISFSHDGQTIASSSKDKTIRFWNINTNQCTKILQHSSDDVYSINFSPDNTLLASGSTDGKVKLWDVKTGECRQILEGHTSWISSVNFSYDGQILASCGDDRTVRLWDVKTGECRQILEGHSSLIRSFSFNPNGQTLASGSDDQTLRLWDMTYGKCLNVLSGYSDRIFSISFLPNSKTIASGSDCRKIRLWDVATGECRQILEGHSGIIFSVSFSPKGDILASSSEDKTVKLWDFRTGKNIETFQLHTNSVWSVSFNPKGDILASGSDDSTIILWDVKNRQYLKTLEGHTSWVRTVKFSPDGKYLASGSNDNTVRLWKASTCECIAILHGHTGRIWSVNFCPDSRILASGSDDNTIRLWEVATGNWIKTLHGHSAQVESVSFSPDGKILASSSGDKTVKLWCAKTYKVLKTLEEHTKGVLQVTFSPTGKTLASGSVDETIKIWDVKTGNCLKTFRADKLYERMNITNIEGLTDAEKSSLKTQGAFENPIKNS